MWRFLGGASRGSAVKRGEKDRSKIIQKTRKEWRWLWKVHPCLAIFYQLNVYNTLWGKQRALLSFSRETEVKFFKKLSLSKTYATYKSYWRSQYLRQSRLAEKCFFSPHKSSVFDLTTILFHLTPSPPLRASVLKFDEVSNFNQIWTQECNDLETVKATKFCQI